jgi:hypothetical protein
MYDDTDIPHDADPSPAPAAPRGPMRLPSRRLSTLLASGMLALGVIVGAAIGPAPEMSFAGNSTEIAKRLVLLAAIHAREASAASAAASTPAAASSAPEETEPSEPAAAANTKESKSSSASEEEGSGSEETSKSEKESAGKGAALPPVSSVWLIELSGSGFSSALAQASAVPTISATVAQGTLLSSWSALTGSAFASEAALLEPPSSSSSSAPPLLHSIVQPACPEGAAGAACAPETPGALTSADEFLKATLATITGTPGYKEHGLVVITFTTVGLPTQIGLPEGSSSATLTSQPPAGVLLLSPFAKAGSRSSVTYKATSPRKTVEKLLHK